jgi:5'(3')-deoxyribonucleotidase
MGIEAKGRRGRMGGVPPAISRKAEAYQRRTEPPYDADDIISAYETGCMSAEKKPSHRGLEITFGVDVDEVLRCLLCKMVALYNELLPPNERITVDDVKDFVVEKSFPKVEKITGMNPSEWFFKLHGPELFRLSDSVDGAVDAVNRLRKYGKVIIISYQKSAENKIDTIEWLEQHNVKYDGICFVKDKSAVHTDYLIDDNDWNFLGCNADKGVLISAPYNMDKNLEDILINSNCFEMSRFSSLSDFVDWYEEEERAKESQCFVENFL